MINYTRGRLLAIERENKDISFVEVEMEGGIYKAVNYKALTGQVAVGDELVLNTTAMDLGLGTGGYHYIIYNYSNSSQRSDHPGHIMKLRYTPYQLKVLAAEEVDSPYHEAFENFTSLEGHICLVATLHSMLAPLVALIKARRPETRVNYIMTDGGALPLAFSRTVDDLKKKKLLYKTITVGHAFGGDLECVNIYTGLIASKEVLKGDISIIAMGPGIVGTGSKYGFTGIEQGYIIDAINNMKGFPIAVPRISFQDKRDRHLGISHHTITILSEITNSRANLVLPDLKDAYKKDYIMKQIEDAQINERHNIFVSSGDNARDSMELFDLNVKSMGRSINDDQIYFSTLAAAGNFAIDCLKNKEDGYGL